MSTNFYISSTSVVCHALKKNKRFTALVKPVFHLVTSARDWLKLAGEKIRREQVETVPTFLSVRANKVAKWKMGFTL